MELRSASFLRRKPPAPLHGREAFRSDLLEGLARSPRAIPARWFYDMADSGLFDKITELPEYYPTRTERELLAAHARDIAASTGPGRAVIELRSGSSSKTPLLLSAISAAAYIPIDISGECLRQSSAEFARRFADLPVYPVEADFTHPVKFPKVFEGTPSLEFSRDRPSAI